MREVNSRLLIWLTSKFTVGGALCRARSLFTKRAKRRCAERVDSRSQVLALARCSILETRSPKPEARCVLIYFPVSIYNLMLMFKL